MFLNSKLVFFFFLAFLAGVLAGIKLQMSSQKSETVLMIDNQLIQVELVKTDEEMAKGLSGREKLKENSGMLFIFNKSGNYPFWMKGMKFNLDFVFIRDDSVVDLVENAPYPKGDKIKTIKSQEVFDKVLEINAGKIRQIGIKIGDKIKLE